MVVSSFARLPSCLAPAAGLSSRAGALTQQLRRALAVHAQSAPAVSQDLRQDPQERVRRQHEQRLKHWTRKNNRRRPPSQAEPLTEPPTEEQHQEHAASGDPSAPSREPRYLESAAPSIFDRTWTERRDWRYRCRASPVS